MKNGIENDGLPECAESASASRSSLSETGSVIQSLALEMMNRKTKPPGSLGTLEQLAIRIAGLQGTISPRLKRKRICVYAGSHGVCEENISAYPGEVTKQMVLNFLNGGAAINVLARHGQIDVHVIDTGVKANWPEKLSENSKFFFRSVRQGTRNFVREPAMSLEDCDRAI